MRYLKDWEESVSQESGSQPKTNKMFFRQETHCGVTYVTRDAPLFSLLQQSLSLLLILVSKSAATLYRSE